MRQSQEGMADVNHPQRRNQIGVADNNPVSARLMRTGRGVVIEKSMYLPSKYRGRFILIMMYCIVSKNNFSSILML